MGEEKNYPRTRPGGGRSIFLTASALVCSEIASLSPAQHEAAALRAFLDPTPYILQTDWETAVMAWPLVGAFLCGHLLGFLCLSGEERLGGQDQGESWE